MISMPHHDGSALYVDRQDPALGDTVTVRLRVPADQPTPGGVWLRSVRDAEPHYDAATRLGEADGWVWWQAGLRIVNPVQKYRWLLRTGGTPASLWTNARGTGALETPDEQDFRIVAGPAAPEWIHRSVMYQVFPDRFARSAQAAGRALPAWAVAADWNSSAVIGRGPDTPYQYFGGDLEGIREHLDHLEAIGATVLYLTPMFPARSNHRYDAAAFTAIDPLLGGDEALIRLIQDAHDRGLHVVGDLTTNHSGDAHEWFRAAHHHPGAPESDFYYFGADNEEYLAWLGVESLPKFNWRSPGLRERFILADDSMVARWLKPPYNLDGWRIDVGNMTGRAGADDFNHEIAGLIRAKIHSINPEALLVAESTSDAAPDFQGDTWHGAMTYTNFTRPLWQWLARPAAGPAGEPGVIRNDAGNVTAQGWTDFYGLPQRGPDSIGAQDFLATHLDFAAAFPWRVRLANLNAIDTHDTARAASAILPGAQPLAAALQFTLPGVPMVFMGDEFGLEGFNGENSRTPMPWDAPERIPADLRGIYADLSALRRDQPALTSGGLRWLHATDGTLAFVRETAGTAVLVVLFRDAATGVGLGDLAPTLPGGCALRRLWGHGTASAVHRPGTGVVVEGHALSAAAFELPGTRLPAPARGAGDR
ncbi:glycoside hydrolase family 13 protein [Arthrobacter sp.]|uniref:glycoside hydrolase family 13 protein n=1 Tax=Arthrobacter sp. TaxID=1667 RepID=UPI003A8CAF56